MDHSDVLLPNKFFGTCFLLMILIKKGIFWPTQRLLFHSWYEEKIKIIIFFNVVASTMVNKVTSSRVRSDLLLKTRKYVALRIKRNIFWYDKNGKGMQR